jgi:hypothetical protein
MFEFRRTFGKFAWYVGFLGFEPDCKLNIDNGIVSI